MALAIPFFGGSSYLLSLDNVHDNCSRRHYAPLCIGTSEVDTDADADADADTNANANVIRVVLAEVGLGTVSVMICSVIIEFPQYSFLNLRWIVPEWRNQVFP